VNKRPLMVTLAASLLVVIAAATTLGVLGARPNLGLDLQGGISAVYTPHLQEGVEEPEDFEEIIDETIEVIRARVDSLGVAEPDISRQGTDVVVQLPGIADADRMQEIIGRTAQLTFRPVLDIIEPGSERYEEGPDCGAPVDERPELADDESGILCGAVDEDLVADPDTGEQLPVKYEVGPTHVTGSRIDDAHPTLFGSRFDVALTFDSQGAREFAEITGELACEPVGAPTRQFAIVLDQVVESAPTMNPDVQCGVGIPDGRATITMGGTAEGREQEQEARDLALILQTGALPITLEPATFQTVSPTLGADSLRSGLFAGGIGLLLVGAWLVFFYRWLGVVTLGALTVFGVMVWSIISALGYLGFALTLAGVAGLIVAIGITADSSIIYFERIRDEVNLGKTVRTATSRAFKSAFRTNLAGNTVTLAAALILYFLATGPVRGFALMLGMATVLDLLILYLFTRPVVGLMANTKLMNRRNVRAAQPEPTKTAKAGAT
jgi:preprotein translocase subunit SecD